MTGELKQWEYDRGFDRGYEKGRADAEKEFQGLKDLGKLYSEIRADVIEECISIIDKIMPPRPIITKSKHYENWKMKTTELRMLRDMLEQLKEQKNDNDRRRNG